MKEFILHSVKEYIKFYIILIVIVIYLTYHQMPSDISSFIFFIGLLFFFFYQLLFRALHILKISFPFSFFEIFGGFIFIEIVGAMLKPDYTYIDEVYNHILKSYFIENKSLFYMLLITFSGLIWIIGYFGRKVCQIEAKQQEILQAIKKNTEEISPEM